MARAMPTAKSERKQKKSTSPTQYYQPLGEGRPRQPLANNEQNISLDSDDENCSFSGDIFAKPQEDRNNDVPEPITKTVEEAKDEQTQKKTKFLSARVDADLARAFGIIAKVEGISTQELLARAAAKVVAEYNAPQSLTQIKNEGLKGSRPTQRRGVAKAATPPSRKP